MSTIPSFSAKNPGDAALLIKFDLSKLLASSVVAGEVIQSIGSVSVDPTGITVNSSSITDAGTSITVSVTGGVAVQNYLISVTFTTSGGQTLTRSAILPVRAI
ncbi:MAG: hypothetical protein KGO96_13555 [Elusimicrobia bacterium]|nr:hypothetical protein [Elusimicrobiota bacterium]